MKQVKKQDLIPHAEYEERRDTFRRRIIEQKRRRRISIGDHVTLLFENRDTVQFQIQEMVRAERIVDPAKLDGELEVYNALLPAEGELSATLFIEVTDDDRLKEVLDAFMGIDHGQTVAMSAGPDTVYGEFEGGHSNEEKISAVHVVRFRPQRAFIEALASPGVPATLRVHHGPYREEVPVPEELRREWLADLGSNAAPSGDSGGQAVTD